MRKKAVGETPFYLNGGTYQRIKVKHGRNEPCTCGSGYKYKNCCGKDRVILNEKCEVYGND
jgi:uncharacterized protein YecA (UPF0149 family)